MSHLELALRRARAEHAGDDLERDNSALQPRTPNAAFATPWHFEDVGPAAAPNVSGVAEPILEVTSPPSVTASAGHARPPAAQFVDFEPGVRGKLVVGDHAAAVVREQFRKVAASLHRLRDEQPLRIVMVVSAVPGEGKTLTSTNLALTLSESYLARVLLVDADLRRPTVHTLFDLPNTAGLKDDLAGVADGALSSVKVSDHLHVLTAGAAQVDPMGALTSERLRRMLRGAADQFDWVIIDTPPVGLLPDAKILAGLADGAILVVEAGSTKYQLAQRAVEAIGRDRMLGVVLNQLAGVDLHDYYSYYGDYRARA